MAGDAGGAGIGRLVDDLDPGQVAADGFGGGADSGGIPDQDRGDDAVIGGQKRTVQRFRRDRANDGGNQRGQGGGLGDQGLEMAVTLHQQARDMHVLGGVFTHRCHHLRLAIDDHGIVITADNLGPQRDQAIGFLVDHRHPGQQFLAGMGAFEEGERLVAVKRPRPRQDRAEHPGDQAGSEHAGRHFLGRAVAIGVEAGQVQRVVIPRGRREDDQVVLGDETAQFGRVAHLQFVEGPVLKPHGALLSGGGGCGRGCRRKGGQGQAAQRQTAAS